MLRNGLAVDFLGQIVHSHRQHVSHSQAISYWEKCNIRGESMRSCRTHPRVARMGVKFWHRCGTCESWEESTWKSGRRCTGSSFFMVPRVTPDGKHSSIPNLAFESSAASAERFKVARS